LPFASGKLVRIIIAPSFIIDQLQQHIPPQSSDIIIGSPRVHLK
jgi:hypothetical protein